MSRVVDARELAEQLVVAEQLGIIVEQHNLDTTGVLFKAFGKWALVYNRAALEEADVSVGTQIYASPPACSA